MARGRTLDTQAHHASELANREIAQDVEGLPVIALVKPERTKPSRRAPQVIVLENFPRLVQLYLGRITIDREPDTVTTYRAQLHHFEAWARAEGVALHVETIQSAHIERYLADMQRAGRARATIRLRHAALKAFYSWAVEQGHVDVNPAARVKGIRKRPDEEEKIPEVLPDVAIARILRACRGRDFNARRDLAMIRVLFDTGMRRGELANMRVEGVNLDNATVETTGKRGTRLLPLNLSTVDALGNYLYAREQHNDASSPMLWLGQAGPLTRMGCYQALKRRARAAGVDAHTHLFRHTFAHAYKAAGGSLEDIAELGGWKSMEMVRRYGRSAAHARAMEDYKRRGLGDRV